MAIMDTVKDGSRALYKHSIMGASKVLVRDLCPVGQPRILTGAQMSYSQYYESSRAIFRMATGFTAGNISRFLLQFLR